MPDASGLNQSSAAPVYWFRAPVWQAMMYITFFSVMVGLVTDIRLGLWAEGESALQLLMGRMLLKAVIVVFVGIFLLCFTPLRTRLLPLINSWNYQEILAVILFLWINSSIACCMKSVIHQNIPFYADPYLFQIERWLHFGVTPTELLYRFLVTPSIVKAAVLVYSSWFLVGLSFLVLYIWGYPGRYGRERVILSFVLCWVINGMLLATALSSVGPIFLGEFFPIQFAHPYAPFLAYVQAHDPFINEAREFLLRLVLVPPYVEKNGISAMPSLHISIAALIYFVVRDYWPRYAWPFLLFVLATLLACLVLLTHYAIDGYVSCVTTWLIWRWSRRYENQ